MYIYIHIYIYPQTRVSSFPGLISVARVNKYFLFIVINKKDIVLSRINRITVNLLLKVSHFFHDLQVNDLLTKKFLVLESFVN